jgi:uncharacterized membrane protein YraQ (UPF0718 family)
VVVFAAVLAAVAVRGLLGDALDGARLRAWSTVFVAICLQALPFLALGVTISGVIAAFVPAGWLARVLPAKPALSVPVAAVAGMALPGCECGSVPIAGRLVARGAPTAAALTFLLAAPAVNPIVLVSTAVAFPGRPEVVAARLLASLIAALVVGLVWSRWGNDAWLSRLRRDGTDTRTRRAAFVETAQHDLLHAGGFLVIGAMGAAALQTVVPRALLAELGDHGVLSVLLVGVLAVLLAVCSEADAFVAASLTGFSGPAQLAFMVVGPMVDVKLVALQAGTFGRSFAQRFAPLTFVTTLVSSLAVGTWLL